MAEYRNALTGEIVPVEQLSAYEPYQPRSLGSSLWGGFATGLARPVFGSAFGAAQAITDTAADYAPDVRTEVPFSGPALKAALDWIASKKDVVEERNKIFRDNLEREGRFLEADAGRSGGRQLAQDVASGMGGILPLAYGGLARLGVKGTAAAYGGLFGGDAYSDYRARDIEPGPAALGSTMKGGAVAASTLPFLNIVRSGAPLLKRMLAGGVTEAGTESLVELPVEIAADSLVDPNYQTPTWSQAVDQGIRTAKAAGVTGFLFPGIDYSGRRIKFKAEQKIQDRQVNITEKKINKLAKVAPEVESDLVMADQVNLPLGPPAEAQQLTMDTDFLAGPPPPAPEIKIEPKPPPPVPEVEAPKQEPPAPPPQKEQTFEKPAEAKPIKPVQPVEPPSIEDVASTLPDAPADFGDIDGTGWFAGSYKDSDQKLFEGVGSGQARVTFVKPVVLDTDMPVVATYVPAEKLLLRPDLFQFRYGTGSGGVKSSNVLENKYSAGQATNFIAFQPAPNTKLDVPQDAFIITDGHHRGSRMKKDNVTGDQQVLVLREQDGWTPELAKMYSAQHNIIGGTTDVADQINFFKSAKEIYGEPKAVEAGKQLGLKARKGKTIALDGSNELHRAFFNQNMAPEIAHTIAKELPKIETGQSYLIGLWRKNPNITPSQLETAAQVWQEKAESGRDPEVWKAALNSVLNEAKADAVATKRAWDNFSKASEVRRNEFVKGVDLDAIKKKLENAKAYEEAVKDWKNSNLRGEIYRKIDQKYNELLAEKLEPGGQTNLFQQEARAVSPQQGLFDSEVGALNLPDIVQAIIDHAKLSKPEQEVVAKELGKLTIKEPSSLEHYMRGDIGKKRIVGSKGVVRAYREMFVFPKTLAERDSEGRPVFERALQIDRDVNSLLTDFFGKEGLEPYFKLKDRSNVNQYLIAARKAAHNNVRTVEDLGTLQTLGLNPAEAEAVLALRRTTDNALQYLEELYRHKFAQEGLSSKKAQEKAAAIAQGLRGQRFVPHSRFGDFYLKVVDPTNPDRTLLRQHFEKESQRDAEIKKLLAQGVNVEAGDVKQEGFDKHLDAAELVPGFEPDLGRSISEYFVGLADAYSMHMATKDLRVLYEAIPKEHATKEYWRKYVDYVTHDQPETQQLRSFLANYYLGMNFKSALVNFSQNFTTTLPVLLNESRNPTRTFSYAMKLGAKTLDGIAKSDPQMYRVLLRADKEGITGGKFFEYATGIKTGNPNQKTFSQVWMKPFTAVEQYNRRVALIAGYKTAIENGKKGNEAFEYAVKMVNDTQFIYSKINRPEIARGRKAAFFTFRTWTGNYIRFLRNHNAKTVLASTAAMIGMGGVRAVPGISIIVPALIAAGYDPIKWARELANKLSPWEIFNGEYDADEIRKPTKKWSDAWLYGLPSLTGMNLSSALQIHELSPLFEQGPEAAIGKMILGPAGALITNPARATWLAGQMAEPGRAVEALMPEAIRNPLVAARGAFGNPQNRYFKGRWESPSGDVYVDNPSALSLGVKALGITPMELAESMERQQTIAIATEKARNNKNINLKLAKAYQRNDEKEISRLIDMAIKENINVDWSQVTRQMGRMQDVAGTKLYNFSRAPTKAKMEVLKAYP